MEADLQTRAEQLAETTFVGGPVRKFAAVGRLQLETLLHEGLWPQAKVLDVGCGALRGGYWLMHFLDPGCYFGIEPNVAMLEGGLHSIVEPATVEFARARFDHNDRFDFSIFGESFDFVLARSVWTHAGADQIEAMLDSFAQTSRAGVFLASYHPGAVGNAVKGWVGRDHHSDEPGMVKQSFEWVQKECRKRSLTVRELDYAVANRQRWLRIEGVE